MIGHRKTKKSRTMYLVRSYKMMSGYFDLDVYRKMNFSDGSASGHVIAMGYGVVMLSTFVKNCPFENGRYLTVGHLIHCVNNEIENLEWQTSSEQNNSENRWFNSSCQ